MAKPRVGGRKYGANADRTPADNIAWCTVESGKVTIIAQASTKEVNDDLILGTGQMGRVGGSMLNLTTMTEAELLAIKQVIDHAFELALPVARRRDEIADEAFAAGDDSFDRVYRAVPRVVFRKGAVEAYMQGVSVGPSDSSSGVGEDGDSDGVPGGSSTEVAEPESTPPLAQDNWTPPHFGQGVGEVGG